MTGTLLGAVMAGGRARRFGSDKAAALLAGTPLIEHALAALAPHVAELVICGRAGGAAPGLADRPPGGHGPLAGLNAALHHAQARGHGGVLSIGCDMPFLPAGAAAALIGDDGGSAAIVEGQHLVGYWPAALAPVLESHLARGDDRSVRGWLAIVLPRVVTLPGPPLPNLNTVADLDALAARWGAGTETRGA